MKINKVMIIAEAGVNHNGDYEIAKAMIGEAAKAGADIIKFQTYDSEKLVTKNASKAEYQKTAINPSESQFQMLKKYEISKELHLELKDSCEKAGIGFLSSAFDIESLDYLIKCGIDLIKVPSGELTNMPYLRQIGALQRKVILSTGMAYLGEIEAAIQVLEDAGQDRGDLTILHCNSEYPTPMADVNLLAMARIGTAFNVKFGYSDHTCGIEIPLAAVALGASVIEKHFTLDRAMEGPDHKSSIEPDELCQMVKAIRNIELALGDGVKRPSASEFKNRNVVRKSIVALKSIENGETYSVDNLTVKRPGIGISPMRWNEILHTRAKKRYEKDELIEP